MDHEGEQEGDRKTPDGLYRIVGKRAHERWSRFMLLDYPNAKDLAVHHDRLATGYVNRGPGGEVGIHGTDAPQLLPGRVSHGCIRLPNDAIVRLARLMPLGTPVTIA